MEKKKYIIVGGVAGGATAAARLRRLNEDAEIIMIERGKYVSFANCGLPYYVGETIHDRQKLLVQTPEGIRSRFNIDVRTESEVIAVDAAKKKLTIQDANAVYEESFDALLLAPGAKPLRPGIPGIESDRIFSLRSVNDADLLKQFADKSVEANGSAVVIGGGFIGVEVAENLKKRGLDVALVEAAPQIMMPFDADMVAFLQRELVENGVRLILNNGVQKFDTVNDIVKTTLADGTELTSDFVVLAIGVKPDTDFLKDSGIELDGRGFIRVNENLQTSAKDIYAVGDAISLFRVGDRAPMTLALAGPANHQGRLAADNICGLNRTVRGLQGTSIIKVFSLTAASTGRNERTLQKENIQFHSVIAHPFSHATYYPGARQLTLKILFDHEGKLLGAQSVGQSGVDKRIDVLAVMIRQGANVQDLISLELCYAPPFSSAKDPVNMVGYMAEDILDGVSETIQYRDLDCALEMGARLIDVRTELEYQNGHLDKAVNIPLDNLRSRLNELSKDEDLIVYCQVGVRGYYAERILKQKGYKVRNLSGGYRLAAAQKYDIQAANQKIIEKNISIKDESMANNIKSDMELNADHKLDLTGLSCPGPLMRLKEHVDSMKDGEIVCAEASDAGFYADSESWCSCTGNSMIRREKTDDLIRVWIRKGSESSGVSCAGAAKDDNKTIIVFSGDLDKALASFIIANGAASMGKKVTMFFTFWGLNILRRPESVNVQKNIVEKMFGWMMPQGSQKLSLSKMNMLGMGAEMIRRVMKDKNIDSLETLIQSAINNGIELVACQMSMDVMGIRREELIDGVKIGGVGYYLGAAEHSNVNLFI
ncbi:MAG: DsrE/DsrF/DrsH-like family protein [Proteobacteria bacterium]|nr:DsrE/DsrF/DrsH-like family protein [Pseudomonadota bacterium]